MLDDKDTLVEIYTIAVNNGPTFKQPRSAMLEAWHMFVKLRRQEEREFIETYADEIADELRRYWRDK